MRGKADSERGGEVCDFVGTGLCIVLKQGRSASPQWGGVDHFSGLRRFREIWEFKIFGRIHSDTLFPCICVLLFLKEGPGLGKDEIP